MKTPINTLKQKKCRDKESNGAPLDTEGDRLRRMAEQAGVPRFLVRLAGERLVKSAALIPVPLHRRD